MNIKERNEELEKKIREAHEAFTKEEERNFTGDSKTYAFGFWCYLRGLKERGKEILAERRKQREEAKP